MTPPNKQWFRYIVYWNLRHVGAVWVVSLHCTAEPPSDVLLLPCRKHPAVPQQRTGEPAGPALFVVSTIQCPMALDDVGEQQLQWIHCLRRSWRWKRAPGWEYEYDPKVHASHQSCQANTSCTSNINPAADRNAQHASFSQKQCLKRQLKKCLVPQKQQKRSTVSIHFLMTWSAENTWRHTLW